jgi:branched-chain amino acid transport system permease protein
VQIHLLWAAAQPASEGALFLQYCLDGLTSGALFALVALGYTMVYGIIELINFAHGEVFMLGSCLAFTLVTRFGLDRMAPAGRWSGVVLLLLLVPAFCALLNLSIDRLVYRPLRHAPKLGQLVSAIGASFVLMNVGLLWGGPADRDFPALLPNRNLLGDDSALRLTAEDLMVVVVTLPIMIALAILVKYTQLGKAMRATAQDATAARLMGIDVDRVIGATFLLGGALAGTASVIYSLYIHTISFQMGFQNGLYAFTAAVLGGIGNIPGAVLGGLVIGLVRSLSSGYIGERWTSALVFVILIAILVFRPAGLLGSRTREKV